MLENCEPANVFQFFEQICAIPHGSGNEKALSDALCAFAKDRGLWVTQDEALNVIIKKPASPGMEGSDPVIIQAHMDMVCEKNIDTVHDFEKDPLALYVDGDFIKARGTTLGADNGIAVAMAMALLDAKDISHSPLEIVLTTDEEVGLLGAQALDGALLDSKRLINLDSEEEGEFCTSCAGGLKIALNLPLETVSVDSLPDSLDCDSYVLKVSGLQGGHSGAEIDKERANSIRILGRALAALQAEFEFSLWDVAGGLKDNAIPREALGYLILRSSLLQAVESRVKELENTYRHEYRVSDPGLRLSLEKATQKPDAVFTKELTRRLISAILLVPNGIQAMSLDVPGLVETSSNLGVLSVKQNEIKLVSAVRSSVISRKYFIKEQFLQLASVLGASTDCHGDYPAWEYSPVSTLRDTFGRIYEEMYGKPAKLTAIHAGLECGHFANKIPGIDMISLGPDISRAHTPEERLSVSSLKRTWEFLIKALSLL